MSKTKHKSPAKHAKVGRSKPAAGKSAAARKAAPKAVRKAAPKAAPEKMKKIIAAPKKTKSARSQTPVPTPRPAAKAEKPVVRRPITPELLQIRARLQSMLDQRRQDIDQEVRGASARDMAHINDTSDMASDAADGDLALRIAESETVEASEIERAIEKVDTGTYGLCEVCNKPINAERLQFLPYVTQCIKCQSLSELRKRDKRDELDDLNAEGGDMDAENN
jgi:RNA polymerase-binding protein DksA